MAFFIIIQTVSIMPILKILGIQDVSSSFVFLGSPVLGLLIGPVLGQWSDRCLSTFGRRRPFLIGFGCVACTGIILIYTALSLIESQNALILAIIATQLMDWGLDSIAAPAYAYTLECITDTKQQAKVELSRGSPVSRAL